VLYHSYHFALALRAIAYRFRGSILVANSPSPILDKTNPSRGTPTKDRPAVPNPSGESYWRIIRLFLPEFVTALVLYSLITIIDAKLVAELKNTTLFATLGTTNTLTYFITKVAEGLSVGTVVLCGHYNGSHEPKQVGQSVVSSLWTTALVGMMISGFLFFGASSIYQWYGVSPGMAQAGVPFLQIRAIGLFFLFLYFSIVGFLRGIKNTRVPMVLFTIGAATFVFFDWVLIYGKWGFSRLGLQGSAYAFMIQYIVMFTCGLLYILFNPHLRSYSIQLLRAYDLYKARRLLLLGFPVMIDKATLAWAGIWVVSRLAPLGEVVCASFSATKDMMQLAFIPAIAFGQVLTLLVSNAAGAENWLGVKSDIKKVIILTMSIVLVIMVLFSLFATHIMQFLFDVEGAFTPFAARAFPILSALALLDLLQLLLSAALRGVGDVRSVMIIRLAVSILFFWPASWVLARMPIDGPLIKFIVVYATFYIAGGIMCVLYIKRLSGKAWHIRITPNKHSE